MNSGSAPVTTPSAKRAPRWHAWHFFIATLALAALAFGAVQLYAPQAGISIEQVNIGAVPLRVYQPLGDQPAPVAVIAHGFAGSQQMMQSFALALAGNGYVAVTFDFPGHGQHRAPLGGNLGTLERAASLLAAMDTAVSYAHSLPQGDGRLALLGHSMAGDILARYAAQHPEIIQANVAISPYFAQPETVSAVPNLMVIYGALEPEAAKAQGIDALGDLTQPTAEDFAAGKARRLLFADKVEHIGVLYSTEALHAAVDWLNTSFSRTCNQQLTSRASALGWLYAGLLLLAAPLARLLPQVSRTPIGPGVGWQQLINIILLPMLLTPVLLRLLPTDFLPLVIGDYLALHFAVYGLLTLLGLSWAGLWPPRLVNATAKVSGLGLIVALVLWAGYTLLAIGLPTQSFVASFFPEPQRWSMVLPLFAGTTLYFIADAWLTAGTGRAFGGYILTTLAFLLSLALAVVLNLNELFFLIIIVPAMLVLFVIFGWLSRCSYAWTGHPLVGAVANALALALVMTATFPVIAP